ncbi:MAG: 1-deoxy-D-xylulose-5-phosphate synthase [Spirochaetia bacterium]|nr:1-deoxy-D-xylulose-5-phosphate synthase [Spirochaetia bacterium]
MSLLDDIQHPPDLRQLKLEQLPQVCEEVREYLIDTLASVGGHFASNLGVVELTVALHYVLNTPEDKLIWDVGHQIYPHKILTGRRELLRSVRRKGGLSGFPKREESVYDLYNTGHAGTSISQLLGEAMARDRLKLAHTCACVIGDASIASGMAFEALNHGGHAQTDCIVVLNDNDMSISKNVGALNQYLNRLITSPAYNKWKKLWYSILMWLPVIGPVFQLFSRKIERTFKDLFMPGSLFSDFGFRYIGPVDGHDVLELVDVLRKARELKGPILIHAYTQKGKGYMPAENDPIVYHSVTKFNREDGSMPGKALKNRIAFSDIVGETLCEIVEKNDRVVVITPAMIEGSGLRAVADKFPDRVMDVGIAEQHSMAFAGGLASGGAIPYLCIYSTFLNRAYDQLIEDVALMNFPVKIIVDRGGCVGPDGETHQGLYDLGVLLSCPNVRVYAPATGGELKGFLKLAERDMQGPIAVRFPKDTCDRDSLDPEKLPDVTRIRPEISPGGKDLCILAVGSMWETGLAVQKELQTKGIYATVLGARWIRPLDTDFIATTLADSEHFVILEDSYIHSSAASYIRWNLPDEINGKHLHTFAFPTESIPHGTRDEILHEYGLSKEAILQALLARPEFTQTVPIARQA